MTDTVARFSNRVDNYIKYRPDYPREILTFLSENIGLNSDWLIADVGCGPGTSSRMFLENGNRVVGVEPNEAMREAARRELPQFEAFSVIEGSSDATNLQDRSVDMVVAAQAFHWFDQQRTRDEFRRVLKPGGYVVLLWNERQLDTTPFLRDYERLLLKYGRDYSAVRHENIDGTMLRSFFQNEFLEQTFENVQVFDLKGLAGRMFSSSYMPDENDPAAPQLLAELASLFANHGENGKIKVLYDTRLYASKL